MPIEQILSQVTFAGSVSAFLPSSWGAMPTPAASSAGSSSRTILWGRRAQVSGEQESTWPTVVPNISRKRSFPVPELCGGGGGGGSDEDNVAAEEKIVPPPRKMSRRDSIASCVKASYGELTVDSLRSVTGRETTYTDAWPHSNSVSLCAIRMAAAGFIHTPDGQCNDKVTCVYCALELGSWEEADDPWMQHQTDSPGCSFWRRSSLTGSRKASEVGSRRSSGATGGWSSEETDSRRSSGVLVGGLGSRRGSGEEGEGKEAGAEAGGVEGMDVDAVSSLKR